MKIQKVKIKDFKVLENFEADIDGKNILLVADNGRGKSSFLQFIQIALGNTDIVPPNATGEGEVVTTKDGAKYTFKVKMKDGKAKVSVTTPDGLKDDRKGVIGSIVGAISFDINEFVELSKTVSGRKKQVEIFKSFLPPDVREEIARLEANVESKFNERTDLNRSIKSYEAKINGNPLSHVLGVKKFETVNIDEVYEKLKQANDINAKIDTADQRLKDLESKKEELLQKELRIKQELQDIQAQISATTTSIETGKDWLKVNKKIDTSDLEQKIKSATELNSKAKEAEQLQKDIDLLTQMKSEAEDLTVLIETQRQAISDAIKDMSDVVEGVEYNEEGLLWNGIPVSSDSLATSEIIELGVKFKMAENPDLGVLFIEHGESIGLERFNYIKELAQKNDWQLLIEQVERGKNDLEIQFIAD